MKRLLLLLLLCATATWGQNTAQPATSIASRFREYTFATKPTAPRASTRITITDCLTITCTAGSGSIRADLRWTGSAYEVIAAVGGGTPGGSDTHVQFNDGGLLFGEAGFTYNKTTDVFTFPTPFTLGAISVTTTGDELNRVVGVTSGIQGQLDAKAATTLSNLGTTSIGAHLLFAADNTYDLGDLTNAPRNLYYYNLVGKGTTTALEGPVSACTTAAASKGRVHFTSTGPQWSYNTGACVVIPTADNATTFTNKTLNVEGTGNSITTVSKIWLEAADCQNATATLLWNTPTSSPAVAACITGTNTQKGVADFADSASLSMLRTLHLPSDWAGAVDAKFKWLTTAITGDVVWQIATICVADAETDDPSFNTASTVTDTAKGTTNQTNDASITGITMTGCAAGELWHIKVLRDAAHASDSLAATARLIGVELTLRRAQ